jgi:hypothetical protein
MINRRHDGRASCLARQSLKQLNGATNSLACYLERRT